MLLYIKPKNLLSTDHHINVAILVAFPHILLKKKKEHVKDSSPGLVRSLLLILNLRAETKNKRFAPRY